MEEWIPLLEIFLHSPSPERDASLWFQEHATKSSAFLSLLLSPAQAHSRPITFFHTLPPFVQSRILSFLSLSFPLPPLRSLATRILRSHPPPDFWLLQAASQLLDEMPHPHNSISNEFYSLPTFCIPNAAAPTTLPWLPLRPDQFTLQRGAEEEEEEGNDDDDDEQNENQERVEPCPSPLDPATIEKATSLKASLSSSDPTPETLRIIARDIRDLCFASAPAHRLAVLEHIAMWEAVEDDETLSVLLSNLCNSNVNGAEDWPSHVLCSVALPQFLTLTRPASRALLSATLAFCKLHPVAAVEALIFPLASSKEGVNAVISDALVRIVKECLHPAHVSAFCHWLLCGRDDERRVVCLPRHRGLISDALVWTEPMFTLFQQIMNLGVRLTPDTAHQLVSAINEAAEKFSRSLKFGNFFLCFVTKCVRAVEFDRATLEMAAKKTDTFVTKSILSKLELH